MVPMQEIHQPEMNQFGEKVRLLRQHYHLTLQELADQLGYATHSYLSAIETGRKFPTALFVLKIARLFDLSTDELLRDELSLTFKSFHSDSL